MDQLHVLIQSSEMLQEFLCGIAGNVSILFRDADILALDFVPSCITQFGDRGDLLEQAFAFFQSHLGLLLFGDILQYPDGTDQSAVIIKHRVTDFTNLPHFAIGPDHSIFKVKALWFLVKLSVYGLDPLQIPRMNQLTILVAMVNRAD